MVRVVNKATHAPTEGDFYIGRGSVMGNIYTHKPLETTKATHQCGSRDEAIDLYREYLEKKLKEKDPEICGMMNKIYERAMKGDVYLVCYCKPQRCHGEVIKELIDAMIIRKSLIK